MSKQKSDVHESYTLCDDNRCFVNIIDQINLSSYSGLKHLMEIKGNISLSKWLTFMLVPHVSYFSDSETFINVRVKVRERLLCIHSTGNFNVEWPKPSDHPRRGVH